jgi:hypothetical protein
MWPDGCGHGKTWAEDCLECEAVSLRGTIESFEPILVKAKQRLQEVENEIIIKNTSKTSMDLESGVDKTNNGIPVGNRRSSRQSK